jgi:hypothetical protein
MSASHGYASDLPPEEQRLLEALLECGFDVEAAAETLGPITATQRQRLQRLSSVFGLLNDYPVEDCDEALLDAGMARISRHEAQRSAGMTLANAREGRERGRFLPFRLPDFISVAAVFLIGASIGWPMLTTVRNRSIDQSCQNNMRHMALAFSHYADDHNGAMPYGLAGIAVSGASWDTVPNVLNLGPMLDGDYCNRGHLNCPGNHDGKNYSYQWQKPGRGMRWNVGRVTVVLGDRNPIIDAAKVGIEVPSTILSPDHGGRGQNTLATDGATIWLDEPVVGTQDNIWLPHGVTRLRAGAQPAALGDVFLAH